MARPLVVVAGVGIAISVISLSLASIMSPGRRPWFPFPSSYERDGWVYPYGRGKGYTPFIDSGEIVTREFNWTGGDRLEILIPGIVHYEPGPTWRVTVKGRQSSVDHLRIEGGRISFDESLLMYPQSSSLEVRIAGPSLESIGLKGSGRLILEHVAQNALQLDLMGSGSVHGQGTVQNLELRIMGSGNAELAELATQDMETRIFGSGNADVAPTGDVEVSIFGSGDVRLHTRPRNVSTRTFGSGRTIQLAPGQDISRDSAADAPPPPARRPERI